MAEFEQFASELAARVTPDEVDLAPQLVEAVVAGGRARPAGGARLGGFGGLGEISELLPLIQALQSCVAILSGLLLMGSASLTMRVHRLTLRDRKTSLQDPPEQPDAELDRAIASLAEQLRAKGIDGARAEDMSRSTLIVLLERPEGAKALLERLAVHGAKP